jgi:hypothetical protein
MSSVRYGCTGVTSGVVDALMVAKTALEGRQDRPREPEGGQGFPPQRPPRDPFGGRRGPARSPRGALVPGGDPKPAAEAPRNPPRRRDRRGAEAFFDPRGSPPVAGGSSRAPRGRKRGKKAPLGARARPRPAELFANSSPLETRRGSEGPKGGRTPPRGAPLSPPKPPSFHPETRGARLRSLGKLRRGGRGGRGGSWGTGWHRERGSEGLSPAGVPASPSIERFEAKKVITRSSRSSGERVKNAIARGAPLRLGTLLKPHPDRPVPPNRDGAPPGAPGRSVGRRRADPLRGVLRGQNRQRPGPPEDFFPPKPPLDRDEPTGILWPLSPLVGRVDPRVEQRSKPAPTTARKSPAAPRPRPSSTTG